MSVTKKKLFIHNLFIGTIFSSVLIFILFAIQMYFGYITTEVNKILFLNFSIFITIGLISFGSALSIKESKYVSKSFTRLIKVLLIVITLVTFFFALLYSSLVIAHIISFFEFVITKLQNIKVKSLGFIYYLSLIKPESLLKLSNFNFIIDVVIFITVSIIAISSLKFILHINNLDTTEEITNEEDDIVSTNCFGFETFVSKKLKRKLAFGYIYKVFP